MRPFVVKPQIEEGPREQPEGRDADGPDQASDGGLQRIAAVVAAASPAGPARRHRARVRRRSAIRAATAGRTERARSSWPKASAPPPASRPASASAARAGRKISLPVAVLAVNRPITVPRCVANQRLTTVAARTVAMQPLPRPEAIPHARTKCQDCVIIELAPVAAPIKSRAQTSGTPEAETLHQRRGERSDEAVEEDADCRGKGNLAAAPPEGLFEGKHQNAGRRSLSRRSEQRDKDDRHDDEGIVPAQVAAKQPFLHFIHGRTGRACTQPVAAATCVLFDALRGRISPRKTSNGTKPGAHSMMLATTPAPTVRPPSRMAKRSFSSIAIGTIRFTSIVTLSPGMTISVPSGSVTIPVTSVVRK